MVGALDDVQVVLDDEHGVAGIHQALEHLQQLAHVLEMQARGGLVQDVEGLAALALLQLAGQLHALGLAARERRGGLAQADIAEAHVEQRL